MKTVALILTTAILAFTVSLAASDDLTRAKELYRAASYDEALGVLDGIPAGAGTVDAIELHEYRVLCLVALDRKDDAKKAIGARPVSKPTNGTGRTANKKTAHKKSTRTKHR